MGKDRSKEFWKEMDDKMNDPELPWNKKENMDRLDSAEEDNQRLMNASGDDFRDELFRQMGDSPKPKKTGCLAMLVVTLLFLMALLFC